MSVSDAAFATAPARMAPRLFVTFLAVAVVAACITLIVWWLAPTAAPPVRNPFGMGLREAAPYGDIGAYILAVQSAFYKNLQQALAAVKAHGDAIWSLLSIGFAYGVFHAAGPGHGKGVIAAYLVADERALAKGFALSLAAAIVQALVAIALVGILAILFNATAATMSRVSTGVEMASFATVALLGAALTWRKSGKLLGTWTFSRNPFAGVQTEDCDHVHLPPPEMLNRLTKWRELAAVVIAAGIRPCAGALVILVFALSQGQFAVGIAATFAMGLGTALTTGAIAALAVFAKTLALRIAGGRGAAGAVAVAAIELLAAAFVLVLGASLLFGVWSSSVSS